MSDEMRRHHARELFSQSLPNLKAAIESEQARIKARNEPTLELLPAVESAAIRFVRCGQPIAGFSDELTRRGRYLSTATVDGTAYQQARKAFIAKMPRRTRQNQYLADTLKELKHAAYKYPQNISELRSCLRLLAWLKNGLPFRSPLNQALIKWHAAAGDILDRAQLWAVDGCRYLRMISEEEKFNPLECIESLLLDDILNAATRLAEDVLAAETPDTSTSPRPTGETDQCENGGDEDDSAFVPATKLYNERSLNPQKGRKFLDKHPEIRTRKPSRNRLLIHAGDWHHCLRGLERVQDEALDNGAVEDMITSIEARTAYERRKKSNKR